jgi:hypothetical protein
MKFALDPLNFADQPEFGSQEKFGTPLQVYGWNNLWPTRELAISAKRKLTCCFCFAFGLRQFLKCYMARPSANVFSTSASISARLVR